MFDYFYNKVKERFPTSEIIITDRGGEGVIHFFVADDLFKEMTRPARVQFLQGVVKGIMGEEFYEAMYVLTGLTISERNQWFD